MVSIWKTFRSMRDGRCRESGRSSEARCREVPLYLYFIPHAMFSSNFFACNYFFYLLSTLMSFKVRLRLKLKVKTAISLCMAIMLDHPWQSLSHSTVVLCI